MFIRIMKGRDMAEVAKDNGRKVGSKVLALGIIGAVVLFAVMAIGGSYNSLVTSRENVNKSWSEVESNYQRRSDLIPNIVSTVKGSANFEQETLTKVVEARASATQIKVNAANPEDLQKFQAAQARSVRLCRGFWL